MCTLLPFCLKKNGFHQSHVRQGRTDAWLCPQTCGGGPVRSRVLMTHTSLLESRCLLHSAAFLWISKGVCEDEAAYTLLPQSLGDPTSAVSLLKYALLAKSFKQYIVNNLVNDLQCLKTFTGLCFCNLVMFHILGATTHQTYLLYSQVLTQTELPQKRGTKDKCLWENIYKIKIF